MGKKTEPKIETKFLSGRVIEVKTAERNGVEVGIIAGYIATWDIDRGSWGMKDQFVRGAFVDSIRRHQVDNRPVRLKDHHNRTVGGFPINEVREDEVGLFAIGEVNLEVQQGKELMSLARQGILSDFSVGFSVVDSEEVEGPGGISLRKIAKAELWEASVVDEPMNPKAKITEVKNNDDDSDDNGDGDESGDNETDDTEGEKQLLTLDDVKDMTEREIEKALKKSGMFSKSAAKSLASRLKVDDNDKTVSNDDEMQSLLDNLKGISKTLQTS